MNKKLHCATEIMQTIPVVMDRIRAEMESNDPVPFSIHQMRAMMFIKQHQPEPVNLSMVCYALDSTLSATSKLVDGLIREGYLTSQTSTADRRIKLISLTPMGGDALELTHKKLISCLAHNLESLSESECSLVTLAMDLLRQTVSASSKK